MAQQISEKDIKGLKVLSTGYKIFNSDWSCKYDDYCYMDKNGNILNTIHKVYGNINKPYKGLDFCENPIDCFAFYKSLPWNKYAKVEAYEKISKIETTTVAKILKIVKIYTFDEFIREIKEYSIQAYSYGTTDSYGVDDSYGTVHSEGVSRSWGTSHSKGIAGGRGTFSSYGTFSGYGTSNSFGTCDSRGTANSKGTAHSEGTDYSRGTAYSYGTANSEGASHSEGTAYSRGTAYSDGTYNSYGTDTSDGTANSKGTSNSRGTFNSKGTASCYGITNCRGAYRCIFCYNITGELYLFNKKTTLDRYYEIFEDLIEFDWYPKFNNLFELKGDKEWGYTDITKAKRVELKEAWNEIPEDLLKYIKSLPEYDEDIFNKVTGNI